MLVYVAVLVEKQPHPTREDLNVAAGGCVALGESLYLSEAS